MKNSGWVAVLDDKAARKCARSYSIHIKGTIGIVILARQHDLISSASDVLRELRSNGLWFNDLLVREALKQTVNEDWY
jgi:predicted nucleic acid-binding protein